MDRQQENSFSFRLLLLIVLVIIFMPTREANGAILYVQNIGEFNQYFGFSGPSFISVPVTANVTAKNSIIVPVAWGTFGSGGSVACSDTKGNIYTVDLIKDNGNFYSIICSSHNVIALTMSDTITISFNGFPTYGVAVTAHEFSGLDTSATLDQTAGVNGNSTTPASGNTAMTIQADELLVGAIAVVSSPTNLFTPGTGFTSLLSTGFTGFFNGTIHSEFRVVSATGSYQADGTLGTSSGWIAGIATYKAAPSGTNITLSGTLYSDEGSTPLSGQTVRLLVEGASAGTAVTNASGNYSIITTVAAGDTYLPLLVYVDDGSVVGTTVTVLDSTISTTINDLNIYADHLITRQDEGGTPLDTGDMDNAKVLYSDADILYLISWPETTVTGTNTVLYILNGHTYAPQGNVNTPHVNIYGTLNAGSNTFTVSGNWTNNNTFTASTSTVTMNGNTDQNITSSGSSFNNLILNNTGPANIVLNDALNVNSDLTITSGKLDTTSINNYNIIVLGNFDQSSTLGEVKANSSTITVGGNFSANGMNDNIISTNYNNATLVMSGAGSLTYNNLSSSWWNGFFDLTVGQSGNTTTILSTQLAVSNQLTVGSGSLEGSAYLYLIGMPNPLVVNANSRIDINQLRFYGSGTQNLPPLLNGYDSTIKLIGNGTALNQTGIVTINVGSGLILDGDEVVNRAVTYNSNGYDLTVGGNIQVGVGSDIALKRFDITNSTVSVGGDFDVRSGSIQADIISTGSTVILNGSALQTITTNDSDFNNLTVTNASTAGVAFTDSFSTDNFTNTTPSSKMIFAAGETYTIDGSIVLQGASGQLQTLESSTGALPRWNLVINELATKSIDYVNVSWSDASGSHTTHKPIFPSNSTDGGNNIDWFGSTNLSVNKISTLISDPFNGTGAGRNHIPGAIVEYSITTTNSGNASPDDGTVIMTDVMDSNVEYEVGSIVFKVPNNSGLTLDAITYSQRSAPTDYIYTPVGPFDPNVAGIKITTNGTFNHTIILDPDPSFTITYSIRIK